MFCKRFRSPGQEDVFVNPALVAAVRPKADRKGKVSLFAGGAEIVVIGEVEQILTELGWCDEHVAQPPYPKDAPVFAPGDLGEMNDGDGLDQL